MANLDKGRLSAEEMDEIRHENIAYEYLCHLEEAKEWIEVCIKEELPPTTEIEENLRNGVYLARIGNFINPKLVPLYKIYDFDQSVYRKKGLQFRHTDNINHWFKAMESIRVPEYIYPDTFDIYDKRNMPKVIYCIHELSLNLYNSGKAPRIQDLLGKAFFTSEEINNMQRELDKSGIQMPSFTKIGQDPDSSVWDVVIAINKALDSEQPDIMKHLTNPASKLSGVVCENEQRYLDELTFSRRVKLNNSFNHELESSTGSVGSLSGDALNLLDIVDIQECILKANEAAVLDDLEKAIKKRSSKLVVKCLKHPHLRIEVVIPNYGAFYLENLSKEHKLSRECVQTVVEIMNEDAKEKQELVDIINESISKGDAITTLKSIEKLMEEIINSSNDPLMAVFYLQEFSAIRSYSKTNLIYEEILGGVTALKAIWNINLAVQKGSHDDLLKSLDNPDAHLLDVKPQLAQVYQNKLTEQLNEKSVKQKHPFLTHTEIQETMDELWGKYEHKIRKTKALEAINSAIISKDSESLMESLLNPDAGILCIHKSNIPIYLCVLQRNLIGNTNNNIERKLTLNEVQSGLNEANKKAEDASKICYSLAMINGEVEGVDIQQLLLELRNPLMDIAKVDSNLGQDYQKALKKFKLVKANNYAAEDKENGSWIYCHVDGQKYYQNLQTHEKSWIQPENFTHSIFLTQQDIKQIIQKVNGNYQENLQSELERLVSLIQAYSRGYLQRKAMTEREYHLEKMEDRVITIQCWWRQCLEIKKAKNYVGLLRKVGGIRGAATKIQSYFRMYQAKKMYLEKKKLLDVYIERNQAIQDLMTKDPLHYVALYLYLLKVNDVDYEEEMELHRIRTQVVKRIRSNRELEEKVNQVDLKIALLIKNQLSARELLIHGNKLSRIESNRRQTMEPGDFKVLHAFNKESLFLLEGYQNLFYTLQTDPRYLARLIYSMSPGRSAKFIDSVIYTLYNYGSTPREECLLLQLFKHALEEEVMMKIERVEDICKGTPLVFKMIVDFNKTGCGHSCLRELLEPLVENILDDESLHLSTDPVEVYKRWVNEQETSSGVMSQLPYDLPAEEAEKIPEVAARIAYSVQLLKDKTEMFIDRILHSVELLPYGIRYTSKVLFNLLKKKFPDEDERRIMKAVGNLLYYRYMIAAIPAADTFGVVTLQPGNAINSIQRKNLGAIAKVLQHAAAFQLFDDKNKLSSLNEYLEKCHNKCQKFLKVACNVEEPETIFCMDNYSEATLLAPPQVSLSLQEIVSTHQLLCKYRTQVAPGTTDKLHQLLDDLGSPITLETYEEKHSSNTICLSLTNKFFEAEETSPFDQLFLTTKQMVIQFLQCQPIGQTFNEMLRTAPSVEDEEKYSDHRGNVQCQSVKDLLGRYANLNELRLQIIRNLRKLEDREYVTKQNDYRDIIEGIAKMIANRRMYRERRKDEIFNLRQTLDQLNNKCKYYNETLDYYNEYVKNCLESMAPKVKKSSRASILGSHEQYEKPIVVKYTATKLHEKGVLLEIAGLDLSQLKHVSFVITASKKTGIYIVKATFMGAAVETVDLDIQILLKQQFEGVTVLEMFGKAKININLLLHLLNKKFVN